MTDTRSQIEHKARFDKIRYAQLWEDADVLCDALGPLEGKTGVSICSAGDNALAMLTLDPARVVVVDLSPAQIACLSLRVAAMRALAHGEFLELMGARLSNRRGDLLDRAVRQLSREEQDFWQKQRRDVMRYGAGGIGKFERYFRIFRATLLPLVHSRSTIDEVFVSRSRGERERFVEDKWFSWRWNLLLKLFFSNRAMGLLGRDPAFFDHVEGSLPDHISHRIRHAAIDLDPAQNPYLHWILKGGHGEALPLSWRFQHYDTIRARLERLDVRTGSLEAFTSSGEKADAFNLSDIFEYMDEAAFEAVYGSLLEAANDKARLVYWNMMVPRHVPPKHAMRVNHLVDAEGRGKAMDKAFFYSDFVVAEVRG